MVAILNNNITNGIVVATKIVLTNIASLCFNFLEILIKIL